MPSDTRRNKINEARKGVWVDVETLEDPDSHVGLILKERIQGKPGYSFKIVHFDDKGPNLYIPLRPDGAKHPLKDIVASLVARAVEIVEERERHDAKK